MIFKILNKNEAKDEMEVWLNEAPNLPELDKEYQKIRKDLEQINDNINNQLSLNKSSKKKYYYDILFGIELYIYLYKIEGFNLRIAADDGFWRYLSIKVIPHIVGARWQKDSHEHYWSRSSRIWIKLIWWYVHLSWQGDKKSTLKLLKTECFDTDTILNLVERPGRQGAYINVYRILMNQFSTIYTGYKEKGSGFKKNETTLMFRNIMKLHTAKILVFEPNLFQNAEKGYVKSLFIDYFLGDKN